MKKKDADGGNFEVLYRREYTLKPVPPRAKPKGQLRRLRPAVEHAARRAERARQIV